MIQDASRLSGTLLRLAQDKPDDKKRDLSMKTHYDYVLAAVPSRMIMPLQDALTCTLPSSADGVKTHNPFPLQPVEILGEHKILTR
jgi:serine/threonine-protein kinase ATR